MKVSAFPLVFAVLLVSLGGIAQGENGEEEEEIVDYDDFAETSNDMPAVEKRWLGPVNAMFYVLQICKSFYVCGLIVHHYYTS